MPEDSTYRVVVVGAGFGGLGMAVALEQAGIGDFSSSTRPTAWAGPGGQHLSRRRLEPNTNNWPDHTFLCRYRVRRFDLASYRRPMPKRPAVSAAGADVTYIRWPRM